MNEHHDAIIVGAGAGAGGGTPGEHLVNRMS
jgi:hypothetical protein